MGIAAYGCARGLTLAILEMVVDGRCVTFTVDDPLGPTPLDALATVTVDAGVRLPPLVSESAVIPIACMRKLSWKLAGDEGGY